MLSGPIATLTGTGIIEERHSKYGTADGGMEEDCSRATA
jgi:hypothetical protein